MSSKPTEKMSNCLIPWKINKQKIIAYRAFYQPALSFNE